jgi:hypothetical protein
MFYAKYLSYNSLGFSHKRIKSLLYTCIYKKNQWPLGPGQIWPLGIYLYKLGRYPLEDVSCQISNLYCFWIVTRDSLSFDYIHITTNNGPSQKLILRTKGGNIFNYKGNHETKNTYSLNKWYKADWLCNM